MIEVNLLPGRKVKKPPFQVNWGAARAFLANVKDPWLLAAAASWIAVLLGIVTLEIATRSRFAALTSRVDAVRVVADRYSGEVQEKRRLEQRRDSLVAQMSVIRALDNDRYIWPHIMDQVSKAMPPYTWLTGMNDANVGMRPDTTNGSAAHPAVHVTMVGYTVDDQAFTTFLRQLQASPWLADVESKSMMMVEIDNHPVTAFTLDLRYRPADSAFLHLVPLVQGAR